MSKKSEDRYTYGAAARRRKKNRRKYTFYYFTAAILMLAVGATLALTVFFNITDITVTDELTGDAWFLDSLVPGESYSMETQYVVTEQDVLAGLVLMGLILFLPAGTWNYSNGWLFLALLFVPMIFLGLALFIKAPALLEKRLQSKEKENTQKGVVAASALMFLGSFVLAGLDFKFSWTNVPMWLVIVAAVILLASYGMYAEVMRENAYLSRTVEVQENQKIIDTGLYGVIRHPMYTATILLFLSVPLVLGSFFGFAVFLIYPVLIVKRIMEEEKLLTEELEGYREYRNRVKFRLIPYLW